MIIERSNLVESWLILKINLILIQIFWAAIGLSVVLRSANLLYLIIHYSLFIIHLLGALRGTTAHPGRTVTPVIRFFEHVQSKIFKAEAIGHWVIIKLNL